MRERIVVGISGASGALIGVRIVGILAGLGTYDVHLVVTAAGERTLNHEIGPAALDHLARLATCHHACDDIGASIASGSFRTLGMIVAPCSIRTLSAIAGGLSDNLLVRAADVQLKERRRLVLVVRESPLHLGHLRTMAAATELGAIIAPPVPAFYLKRGGVCEMVDDIARRAIASAGVDVARAEWTGEAAPSALPRTPARPARAARSCR